jgi:hypothetical protein
LLAYGLLNAALYACLLPLWEGFDEEFHYGYVQYLGAHHRFPVLGGTGLSEEINQSISLLPMSHVMIDNLQLQGVRTFDQYFGLDSAERHRLYREAWRIPTELRSQESARFSENYEVHHAPLAYLALLIPDWLMRRAPLPARVLVLRLIEGVAATLLMFFGARALAREVGLEEPMSDLLVFLVFSCQMFWASVAHVANDWLAVPLAVWLIVAALRFDRAPTVRAAAILGSVFGAGLLSKAYFLVFVPLYVLAAVRWRWKLALAAIPVLLAGPWYLRNVLVYGNLSGRLEESSGVSLGGALTSLTSIPWTKAIPFMARGALWMGNSSFTDFSVVTVDLELAFLAVALVLYVRSTKRESLRIAAFLWGPVLLFCAAMVYVAGSSYMFTHGLATAASPWYLQAVMPLLLCAALLGCQNASRLGRPVASLTAILWGYVLAATYIAKLFPLYGGFGGGRSTLREIVHWYATAWPAMADILNTTALAPAYALLPLLLCLLGVLLVLLPMLLRSLFRSNDMLR